MCPEDRPREDSETAALCKPRREASGARKLGKEPLAFKTVRNTFLLFLSRSLWEFVRVALRWGFSGGASGKELACQCRSLKRCGSGLPCVGKIFWRRVWQPTPVFLPGESHGQRSLTGYSPWGHKESETTERLSMRACTHACTALSWLIYSLTDDFFPRTFYEIETSASVNESVLRTVTNHCSKANGRLDFLDPLWMQRLCFQF